MIDQIPEELLIQYRLKYIYDEVIGKFYTKHRYKDKLIEIGCKTKAGYITISCFDKKSILAHRLAFIIKLGYLPEEVDHIDGNKSNNIWTNLRESDRQSNSYNAKQRNTNASGLKGVSWAKSNNCWRMDIMSNKKRYHSYHATKELAYLEYCRMAKVLHGEFANVG